MNLSTLFIFGFLILLGIIFWLILEMKKKGGGGDEKLGAVLERLKILSEQNRELRETMDSKLSETHRASQAQISQTIKTVEGITGQSARQIADVVAGLTKLEETNKQVINFSAQLQNLQDIL